MGVSDRTRKACQCFNEGSDLEIDTTYLDAALDTYTATFAKFQPDPNGCNRKAYTPLLLGAFTILEVRISLLRSPLCVEMAGCEG